MLRRIVCTALLAAGVAHAESPAPAAPEAKKVTLVAKATIGADGRITGLEWLGDNKIEQLLQARLEPRVRAWEFTPGALDGVPAETRTRLSVTLSARPAADGGLALEVLGAGTGPTLLVRHAPAYPSAALRGLREALVTTTMSINADGTTSAGEIEVEASHGDERAFRDAVKQAMAKWSYEPETVGGRPVTGTFRVPTTFCLPDDSDWCARRKAEKAAAGMPMAKDGEAVGLESAVKLKTEVAGQAI
jgi:TonB family protein